MGWDVTSWFREQAASRTPQVARRLNVAYLADRTTNQFDAVGIGSPIFVAGTVAEQACVFDGIDDTFAVMGLDYDTQSLDHGLTVEARINVDSWGEWRETFNAGEQYWRLAVSSDGRPNFYVYDPSGAAAAAAVGSADITGTVHMVSGRYDPSTNGGRVAVFVDGAEAGAVDSAGTAFGTGNRRYPRISGLMQGEVFNGARNDNLLRGRAEEFRIWHVARTDTEINSYHDTTSISDTASGLQLHYALDQMGDLSDRVTEWPRLQRSWNDLRSQAVDLELANDDGALNAFFQRPQAGLTTFALQFGFTDGPTDRIVGALSFDGADQYVSFSSFQSITEKDFIVEVYADTDQGNNSPAAFSQNIPGNWNNDLFLFYIGESQGRGVRIYWDGNSALTLNDTSWFGTPTRWSLLKIGTTMTLYQDGVEVMEVTGVTGSWTSTEQNIAAANDAGAYKQFYEGALSDVRVWDVSGLTKTQAEQKIQNNINKRLNGDETGLVGYWPLNDQIGEFAQDLTSNKNTGTLQNGPEWRPEYIIPFVGRLGSVSHDRGRLTLTVDDKVAQLSDLVVGDDDSPVTYTDSTLPSDIAWDVLTNHGPFSDVESTSNPDIDWSSFADWSSVFSGDSVWMNAHFDGQKGLECLRKIARHTQSAIYMEGGKFYFHRFTAVNTETTDIGPDEIIDSSVKVDMLELVTKQTVLGAYNVDSEEWGIVTSDIDSESSVSYGLRENVEKDENVWYVNSVSALNLAQRYTTVGGNPYEQVSARTTLAPVVRQVGETISFVDAQAGLSKGYRIMGMELDMGDGTLGLEINASQTETPFILDASELDGSDKLL